MKKILFALICAFMLPIVVNADYSLPTTYEYDVIITNKNGATVYEESNSDVKEYKASKEKIAYNTKATVFLENYYKGKYYLRVGVNGENGWDQQKWILWDDAKIVDEKVELNDENVNTTKKTGYYYTIADTKMYKGPSSLYGEINGVTIPKGTLIEYDYIIDDTDNGIPMWIHVKYEKTEGYVYCYNWFSGTDDQLNNLPVTVAEPFAAPMKILTLGEMDIYSYNGVVSESKKIGTIPKGEKVEFLYSINSGIKSTYYYVEYNNIKGWVELYTGYCGGCDSDYGEYEAGEYFAADNIKLYNHYTDTKEVGILPFETIIEGGIYKFYIFKENNTETMELPTEYAYIEYKGKGYYIKDKDVENLSIYAIRYDFSKKYEITLKSFVNLYTHPYNLYETPILALVPFDTKFTSIVKANVTNGITGGTNWYLVEYETTENNTPVKYQGWLKLTDYEADIKEIGDVVESTEENNKTDKSKGLTPIQIGLLCGAGAILITIVSAIVIIKVNKKKKLKKETEDNQEKNK